MSVTIRVDIKFLNGAKIKATVRNSKAKKKASFLGTYFWGLTKSPFGNPGGVSGVEVGVDHRQRRFTEYQSATLTALSGY